MQFQVETDNHIQGRQELQQRVEASVLESLGHLGNSVTRIIAHLSEPSASRSSSGAPDFKCLLEARVTGLKDLAVSHHAPNLAQAIDGAAGRPYAETDKTAPLNVYGDSKASAERAIAAMPGRHLLIRTAAFFSPFDPHNFATQMIGALREQRLFHASPDHIVTPTYVPDLSNAVLDLVIDEADGIWHLSNTEPLTWFAFATRLAARCGLDNGLIKASSGSAMGWKAMRPAMSALTSDRGVLLPPLAEAIDRFAATVGRVVKA